MRKLKRMIRNPYLPLQQCINRISELQNCSLDESEEKVVRLQTDNVEHCKSMKYNSIVISIIIIQ